MRTEFVQCADITSEQIETLSIAAGEHGDIDQVSICQRALNGDTQAVAMCQKVIDNDRAESMPWAAKVVKVEGGYMGFESVTDYNTWRKQK